MRLIAIDTSVLLAIFKGESRGEEWLDCLQAEAETSVLLISSVVLAEVRAFFPSDEICRQTLLSMNLKHSPYTEGATLLAGRIFQIYREEGGPRKAILPDFLVAAHATTQADLLATDDRGYLRRYFPALQLLVSQLG